MTVTLPYSNPTTSYDAAKAMRPSAANLREKVYAYVLAQGIHGATDEQIQDWLEMNPSTERPRRGELVGAGRMCQSGEIRATKSGRSAVVWIAVGAKP